MPERIITFAVSRTMRSLTWHRNRYQEFQPMGGVWASPLSSAAAGAASTAVSAQAMRTPARCRPVRAMPRRMSPMRRTGIWFGSVTAGRSAVADPADRSGQEAPPVTARPKRERQDAEGRRAHRAIPPDADEAVVVHAAAADGELHDPAAGSRMAQDVLRREALVHVGVAVEHHIDPVVVERLPERVRPRGQEVPRRREPREGEVRQRAG